MKRHPLILLLVAAALQAATATQANANPLAKVFELMDGLKKRITADVEKEAQAYRKFVSYCGTSSNSVQHEVETSTSVINRLTSKVAKLESDIQVADSKVMEFTASISKAESELKGATAIREKEAEEFVEGEKALMTTVDTLERALSTLEKQASAGKSFAQLDESTMASIVQTLSVIDDAAALDSSSMEALSSLVQTHEDEGDSDVGAPAAAAYTKQSGGIMEVLEDMKDKADGQLSDHRNSEVKAKQSYGLLKQGLEDEIATAKKELQEAKSGKAEAAEEKASAEGNLEVAKREKSSSEKKNEQVSLDCQTSATDHEANVAASTEELKVIGDAEQILRESMGGGAASFLQVSVSSKASQRAKAVAIASAETIRMIQNLAKQHHSTSLTQLASRISAELKYSTARRSADPFKKVRDLVTSMIDKLEKEASEEATEKAYCDEEMTKTEKKNGALEDIVTNLGVKIEKSASKSAALKESVAELMNEVSVLVKEQASMDKIRREESDAHMSAKQDLEKALNGVKKAQAVLSEFYAADSDGAALLQEDDTADHDDMSSLMQQAVKQPAPPQKAEKSTGAAQGILSLLEVVESDLAKNLATEDTGESDSQSNYEKQTQVNKVTLAQKETDIKMMTQEFKSLDKSISELESDKATNVDELAAVREYFAKVKERCVAKPTSYEQLKERREAEIQGLKDALASIESANLMQVGTRRKPRSSLRGDALRPDGDAA
jgi:hypothetical protein